MYRSPSMVPQDAAHDMYLVLLDAFGVWVGRAWRETNDDGGTYREMLIRDLLHEVYSCPVRIVAFNPAEGWSRNITIEIAAELKQRRDEGENIPASVQHLLELAGAKIAVPASASIQTEKFRESLNIAFSFHNLNIVRTAPD